MKLSFTNIAKFQSADVEIRGITLIAGTNSTGKSTISKVLYSVFSGFYAIDSFPETTWVNGLDDRLRIFARNRRPPAAIPRDLLSGRRDIHEVAQKLFSARGDDVEFQRLVSDWANDLSAVSSPVLKTDIEDLVQKLKDVLSVTEEDLRKFKFTEKFYREFDGQVANISGKEGASVTLTVKDSMFSVQIDREGQVVKLNAPSALTNRVVYVDDPDVLSPKTQYRWESIRRPGYIRILDHRAELQELLLSEDQDVFDRILGNQKLRRVLEKINALCNGQLVLRETGFKYQENGLPDDIEPSNISAGLKTFLILKRLLGNGAIHQKGMIILDEPEVHLHPQWQLVFAEILVLLQKEYDLHVLMASHSPYFIRALQVFSQKHGVGDKVKLYKTSAVDGVFRVEDVTGSPNKIYNDLAAPLQDLDDEQYSDDNE